MQRVLVSLMVIGLVGGMMGTVVADFSDIEISQDNYFNTGSLDLRVSDYKGVEYDDPSVPALIQLDDAWPGWTTDFYIGLRNAGTGTQSAPWAYLHIKNLKCYGIETNDGKSKTRPELAAERGMFPVGEKADGKPVYAAWDWTRPAGPDNSPLLGEYGEKGELSRHVDIKIFWSDEQVQRAEQVTSWRPLELSGYDTNWDNMTEISEIVCKQVELGQIKAGNKLWFDIRLRLQEVDEDSLGFNLFDETNPIEAKFDHWPTSALEKDGMKFDMAFELFPSRMP
jgi:hypothetical protein